MAENNKRLLILGKSGGGGDSTGVNLYENQILLPLYFENISDNSIDLSLNLDVAEVGGYYHDDASLEKSYNNMDWEPVVMPTKQSTKSYITIQPKSRVYFRGINENGFCYNWNDFYNHFCFDLDYKRDSNYVYVGGNLLSLIIGNDFLSVPKKDIVLKGYSLSRLFTRGATYNNYGNLKHFEKMTIGLPFRGNRGNHDLILSSHTFDYICDTLNLSDESIYTSNKNCAVGVSNVIINNRINKEKITTSNNVNIGTSSFYVNSNYNYLYNKPTIPSKTSQLTNDSNFLTESNLKTINGESIVGEGNLVINSFSGSYNDLSDKPTLSIVATTGSYNDLIDKPTIPDAQVNSDWNSESGVSQILNKPNMATQTLTFVDENNVETNVIVYIQPTV